MPVTITRQVQIDFGRDGTYSHALADVTSYVLSLNYSYGFSSVMQEVADSATLTLTLGNFSGDWWQDKAAATFYNLLRPGLWVRVRYAYNSTTYQGWEGRIIPPITYQANPYGERTITIVATDELEVLNTVDYMPPLSRDVTVDTEIRAALANALAYPYHEDVWVLGASTLGTNTRLPDVSARVALDTGIQQLDYVGAYSGTGRGTTVLQYIRELAASECGGRFFWDARSGKWTFFNRHHGLSDMTSTRTITQDDIQDAQVSWGEGLANKVFVNYALMTAGAAGSVVWAADNIPFRVDRGGQKEFTVRYRDSDNDALRVAAVDYIQPVAGVDWTANTNPEGGWLDLTREISVFVDWRADGAQVRLINNSPYNDAYILQFQLRATPITALDSRQTAVANADSISNNGYYPLTVNIPWANDDSRMFSYANWLLSKFDDAETRFHSVTMLAEYGDASALAALASNIGDRITVTEAWSGHNADYMIVGKQASDTGNALMMTLLLQSAATLTGWLLSISGRGELGTKTYLVF